MASLFSVNVVRILEDIRAGVLPVKEKPVFDYNVSVL